MKRLSAVCATPAGNMNMALSNARSVTLALMAAGALLSAGCNKPAPAPQANESPGTTPAAQSAPAAFVGTVMKGGDTEALRSYLRTVQPIEAKKFAVTWTPATVSISREAALRTLLAVSRDGGSFTFDSSEPMLAQLRPGSILFVWGVALRKVTAVEAGATQTVVRTTLAALQEAIAEGDIEFDHNASLSNYMVVPRDILPPATPAQSASAGRASQRPLAIRLAAYAGGGSGDGKEPDPPQPPDPGVINANFFKGEVKGFEYTLAFVPGDGGLDFDFQIRKTEEDKGPKADPSEDMRKAEEKRKEAAKEVDKTGGAPKEARERPGLKAGKELMDIISETLDMRIQAKGKLQGVSGSDKIPISARLVIQGGGVSLLQSTFRDLSGTVNIQYIVRRGEMTTQWIEKGLRLDLPLTFNVPIIVGGLPLMLVVGFDLIAQPALTTKKDSFRGAFTFKFGGSAGPTLKKGVASAAAEMAGEGASKVAEASSIGVSAVLVALQAPRIGLGIGLFGVSTIAYVDMVTSTTVTSGGTLGMFPCRTWNSTWTMHTGINAKIVFLEKDFKKEVLRKAWHKTEPPIKACELKEDE